MSRRNVIVVAITVCLVAFVPAEDACADRANDAVSRFNDEIRPILARHCYDCHGDGTSEGQVTLDEFTNDAALMESGLWLRVLKNVRAGIMPPAGVDRIPADDVAKLANWIKRDAFAIDPDNPDPGQVTLRRLNRNEYRRTVMELTGYDYRSDESFPADDTGHGFDNIGDVLSTSPLLVEKYLRAATEIVRASVPAATKVIREQVIPGSSFIDASSGVSEVSCDKPGQYTQMFRVEQPGKYSVSVKFTVYGRIIFDTGGQADVNFRSDDDQIHSERYAWQPKERSIPTILTFEKDWQVGEKKLAFEVEPVVTDGDAGKPKPTRLALRISEVRIQGPSDETKWVTPPDYDRYFPRPEPPQDAAERREYARQVLRPFVVRAFRRPVDEQTLDRLTDLAESTYTLPDSTFEQGIQQAMIATLSSRRFLFRVEHPEAEQADRRFPQLDEYSLASRLSYLLWSSMPDQELIELAARGELRDGLESQVRRMLADPKSSAFIENFAGQWLRTREVDSVEIDSRLVLARDLGVEAEELGFREAILTNFLEERKKAEKRATHSSSADETAPEETKPLPPAPSPVAKPPQLPAVNLDASLRAAMRAETETCVEHVFRESRSILELIDSDYTFLNERLALHYGIEGIKGDHMRKVDLPENSPRGGVLTHAGILTLTSQSTRTSAVKRGLFVLDSLLGTPAPPAPPNLPPLEEAEQAFVGREPTLRETLELHRRNPVCSSCHNRMDPIGFSLENFNALGMWRTQERGQEIDVAGQLATGEELTGIADLRKVIVKERRADFYRCATEKLMIYALGRGLEHYDTHTVDQIVERLEQDHGNSFSLLLGVIESAAFQKCRGKVFGPSVRSTTSENLQQ